LCVAIKNRKKEDIKGRIRERERERERKNLKREIKKREEDDKKMGKAHAHYVHTLYVQEAQHAQPSAGVARGL
jgi:predicted AlkP superfamily phosphohydrolase/phosphomutase